MALSEADGPALASWLATATGADEARIARLERLGGGAIQENWALDVDLVGGRRAGRHALVLRTDAPTRVAVSWNRAQEYRILEVAHARRRHRARADRAAATTPAVIGQPFYLMRRVAGEARGYRAGPRPRGPGTRVRRSWSASAPSWRSCIAWRRPCPDSGSSRCPRARRRWPASPSIARHLDAMGSSECVLEWALAWLERHAPPAVPPRLIHADFRTGNYLVHRGRADRRARLGVRGVRRPARGSGLDARPLLALRRLRPRGRRHRLARGAVRRLRGRGRCTRSTARPSPTGR